MGFIQNAKEFFGMASPAEQPDYVEDYVEPDDYDDKYSDKYGDGYGYGDSYQDDYAAPQRAGSTPLPPLDRSRYGVPRQNDARTYPPARHSAQITTVSPKSYAEAELIGQRFRDGNPVVMDLSKLDSDLGQRLVDFASGLVFALNGSLERIAKKVFLLSPAETVVDDGERRRLERDYEA